MRVCVACARQARHRAGRGHFSRRPIQSHNRRTNRYGACAPNVNHSHPKRAPGHGVYNSGEWPTDWPDDDFPRCDCILALYDKHNIIFSCIICTRCGQPVDAVTPGLVRVPAFGFVVPVICPSVARPADDDASPPGFSTSSSHIIFYHALFSFPSHFQCAEPETPSTLFTAAIRRRVNRGGVGETHVCAAVRRRYDAYSSGGNARYCVITIINHDPLVFEPRRTGDGGGVGLRRYYRERERERESVRERKRLPKTHTARARSDARTAMWNTFGVVK